MSFATSINCIDGRVQMPIQSWIKEKYHVDYVDAITEPGCDKVFAEKNVEKIESIKYKAMISINAHSSKLIVVSGHHDCAANPVSKEEHLEQVRKAVDTIKSWNTDCEIIGVWINADWGVEAVE